MAVVSDVSRRTSRTGIGPREITKAARGSRPPVASRACPAELGGGGSFSRASEDDIYGGECAAGRVAEDVGFRVVVECPGEGKGTS